MNINYPDWFYYNKKRLFGNIDNKLWNDYKWHLANRVNDIHFINKNFPSYKIKNINEISSRLNFCLTPYIACLINPDNTNDPVANQLIPSIKELDDVNYLKNDPFNEKNKSPERNIVKRYPDRVVFLVNNKCASYCRYCTRKRIWNENIIINEDNILKVRKYLINNKTIREVIISGGEPFLLQNILIDRILSMIFSINHIETVRIGTRILTFLPQRFNKELLKILNKYKPIWLMTHFNHSQEITPETDNAVNNLIRSGIVLANQSVLLKNINNNHETIKKLNHHLQFLRIYPYYLFQCDLVSGTKHLRSSINDGIKIIKKLRGNTGGIAIPTYIIDLPDGGKIPVMPEYIIKTTRKKITF